MLFKGLSQVPNGLVGVVAATVSRSVRLVMPASEPSPVATRLPAVNPIYPVDDQSRSAGSFLLIAVFSGAIIRRVIVTSNYSADYWDTYQPYLSRSGKQLTAAPAKEEESHA